MTAPDSFIETIRARLVYPRRNVARARDALQHERDRQAAARQAREILDVVSRQIAELQDIVDEAQRATICTCPCGHVHYKHGDAA